jgi:hypothetical protein
VVYAIEIGSDSIKFHRDWFRHSEVVRGGYTYRHTDTVSKVISYAYYYFFKIRKVD